MFPSKSEKLTPGQVAKARINGGHTILIWEIETKVTWNGGPNEEKSDLNEEIEGAGWHLDHSVINGQRWQLIFRKDIRGQVVRG